MCIEKEAVDFNRDRTGHSSLRIWTHVKNRGIRYLTCSGADPSSPGNWRRIQVRAENFLDAKPPRPESLLADSRPLYHHCIICSLPLPAPVFSDLFLITFHHRICTIRGLQSRQVGASNVPQHGHHLHMWHTTPRPGSSSLGGYFGEGLFLDASAVSKQAGRVPRTPCPIGSRITLRVAQCPGMRPWRATRCPACELGARGARRGLGEAMLIDPFTQVLMRVGMPGCTAPASVIRGDDERWIAS